VARVAVFSVVAAVGVFCVVQDRVTAAGARQYVRMHREAAAAGGPEPSLGQMMDRAVRQSVWYGLVAGGATAGAGLGAGVLAGRRTRRD
jgi:hypothetical protein